MNRYRIRYKKSGPMRYISHLDLLRTMERSARRARLPLAFTEGFNPHPKVSFAAPLPVGVEGEDEYMDLELETPLQESLLVERLNAASPPGLEILECKEIDGASPSLMGLVDQATYSVQNIRPFALDDRQLTEGIREFVEQQEIIIEKKTKRGIKQKNIRPGIIDLRGTSKGDRITLEMTLKTGSRENIRPEEVLHSLGKGYLPVNVEDFRITRTGLYTADNRSLFAVS